MTRHFSQKTLHLRQNICSYQFFKKTMKSREFIFKTLTCLNTFYRFMWNWLINLASLSHLVICPLLYPIGSLFSLHTGRFLKESLVLIAGGNFDTVRLIKPYRNPIYKFRRSRKGFMKWAIVDSLTYIHYCRKIWICTVILLIA